MIDERMLNHMAVEPECEVIEAEVEAEPPQPFTFLDVLCYPVSRAGLSVLGFYFVMPLILFLTTLIPIPVINLLFYFLVLVAGFLVLLSTLWYLTVCIRSGAEGQRRAPALFEETEDDTLGGWIREILLVLTTIIFCVGPAFIVRFPLGVDSTAIFWAVFGAGLFLLPMCLLSMVMFDHLGALNPLLIIPSIFSTFFSYCLVVILYSIPIVMFVGIWIVGAKTPILPVVMLVRAVGCYLLMVASGLLGWFFYKNEEKLRWDV